MNKTPLRALLFLAASLLPLGLLAQEAEYRYDDATQLWRLTDNAAGLSLDSTQNRGYAELQAEHREGDYRRVQQGGQRNQLQLFTERYQRVGEYLVGYGRFLFGMDRTKDRAWADELRPYNSNPFISGSSVSGKYDTQDFDMTAAIATNKEFVENFLMGLRLDYQVGDLSRLRDPRSRSQLLDYRIGPSFVYTIGQEGRHHAGLSGYYQRRKEKVPSITTVQTDPNLKYYQMTGLEQATGIVGGYSGFNREWVMERGVLELQYGYKGPRLNSVTTLGLTSGTEHVYGTYKYEPGLYRELVLSASARNRISAGRLLHEIDLGVSLTQAYADEYRQQLLQERDAEHGYTSYSYETLIEYKKRYQSKLFDATLRYRANLVDPERQLTDGYLGLSMQLATVSNKHLLPQSQLKYDHLDVQAEGGYSWLHHRLWLDLSGGYHAATRASMQLADPTTDYAQQVLLPDMSYYRANYWQGHAQLKYLFPLSIKGHRSTFFAKLYGSYLHTDNDLSRQTIGIGFGIYN